MSSYSGIESVEGFNRLPAERPYDPAQRSVMEPALAGLLRDLDLNRDPGIKEISCRVQLTDFADLLVLINWKAKDWVRHLGSQTAWRLGRESIFLLRSLGHVDGLVEFLENTADSEGWIFALTERHHHAFAFEINSVLARARWNKELFKAVKNEIDQLSGSSRGQNTSGGSSNAAWSCVEQPSNGLSLPPTTIVMIPEELSLDQNPGVAPEETRERTEQPQDTETNVGEPMGIDDRNKQDFWKKCFLNILLIANGVSVLFTLEYGFNISVIPDPPAAPTFAPTAPTMAPTPAPYRTNGKLIMQITRMRLALSHCC